jgi:hypothetical protein
MYGLEEDYDLGMFLDGYWVYKNYKDVYCYAGEINKGYKIVNAVGIVVTLSPDGKLSYSEEDYKNLMRFKDDYEKFHEKKVELKYMKAIDGDYMDEMPRYTFEDA